jgi:hypothetical protein
MPLAHALVLTLLALVPAAADAAAHPAEGVHHHLISASIAGAVTLVAGSCLLPILALQLAWNLARRGSRRLSMGPRSCRLRA